MRKILAGFLLAVVIGVPAVFFGLPLWAEQRARNEVDAVFDTLRASGAKASHGAISYDVWARTLKVTDVAIESGDAPPTTLKAGQIIAARTGLGESGRFSADRVEIINGEADGLQLGSTGPRTTYRAPKIVLEGYSGPTSVSRRQAIVAGAEGRLSVLEAAANITATTVSIPTLSAAITLPQKSGAPPVGPADYGFTAVTLHNVAEGRVASLTVERITMAGHMPELGSMTSEIDALEAKEIDFGSVLAVLDPASPKDDSYRRLYGSVASGPYRASLSNVGTVQLEGFRLDDFAFKPSKMANPEILALGNAMRSGTLPLADPGALVEKFATVYEGTRLGKFEARGLAITVKPNVTAKVGLVRLSGLEDGKLAELAVESVDSRLQADTPVKIGRAAIKNIDFVKIMRSSARLQRNAAPDPEKALAFFSMFGGFELKDFSFEKVSGQPVRIDNVTLSWGQFVGVIPSQVRAASQFAFTLDPNSTDKTLRYLLDAGLKQVTANLDVGADWNENSKALVVAPFVAEFANVWGATAKLTINNVPRAMFSADPIALAVTATQLEAGTLEFSMRDLGGLDLVFAQIAKEQRMTPEFARRTMADAVRAYAQMNPEAQGLATAIARFIEIRGTTLNVIMTPVGRVNLMQAIENVRINPQALFSQFKIEAATEQ